METVLSNPRIQISSEEVQCKSIVMEDSPERAVTVSDGSFSSPPPLDEKESWDLQTLDEDQWLNDNVINKYIEILQKEYSTALAQHEIELFNTYFFSSLLEGSGSVEIMLKILKKRYR